MAKLDGIRVSMHVSSQELAGEVWPDNVPSMYLALPADPSTPPLFYQAHLRPNRHSFTGTARCDCVMYIEHQLAWARADAARGRR